VVQARTGSARLPGKVLADLCGRPLLAWLLERVRPSRLAAGVAVATTIDTADDAVAQLARDLGIAVIRGDRLDVLGRFAQAARELDAPVLVRLSGDSPLIDATTVDFVLDDFARGGAEVVENHRASGWPVGTAVEVLTRECLDAMAAEATAPGHREHVTTYAYETEGRFTVRHVAPPPEACAPTLRLCVDTQEDLDRLREVCAEFAPRRDFGLAEIVRASAA